VAVRAYINKQVARAAKALIVDELIVGEQTVRNSKKQY